MKQEEGRFKSRGEGMGYENMIHGRADVANVNKIII